MSEFDLLGSNDGSTEEVEIHGVKFVVSAEQADALRKRELDFERKISEQGRELGELRKKTGDEPDKVVRKRLGELILEDPEKAVEEIEAQVERKVAARVEQKNAQEQFWQGFYDTYPKLKDYKFFVQSVLTKHFDELQGLSAAEGMAKLATKVVQYLPQEAKKEPNPDGHAEGESNIIPMGMKPAEKPTGVRTLSSVIKERRATKLGTK